MRITGGIYRSRTLRVPRGVATRPTSDRVREALFGVLSAAGRVEGARVLDLYAGTGALAIEALSRGAVHATLAEKSRLALGVLRDNVAALALGPQTRIEEVDVTRAAHRLGRAGPFDLVLADPPWALVDTGEAPRALEELVDAGALAGDAMLVLEHASRSAAPTLAGLHLLEIRRYGDTALALYKPAILATPRSKLANNPPE